MVHDGIKHKLMWYGVVLFTLGIVTQLLIYFMVNPRMAQSAHTVALMSGMFLVLLGLIWDKMDFPDRFIKPVYWLYLYSTYSAWGSMFVAAIFGTSRNTPFASKGISGAAAWQETITDLAYLSFFITIVLTCLVSLWGLRRGADQARSSDRLQPGEPPEQGRGRRSPRRT